MNKRSPRKTAEQWAQIITNFNHSGLSPTAFCKQHRLVAITFHKWKRCLSKNEAKPAFLPVQPVQSSPHTQSSVKLHIGSSITLVIEINGSIDEY